MKLPNESEDVVIFR